MATKTSPRNPGRSRAATIQWVAIAVVIALAVVASFVLLGNDSSTGGHTGLGTLDAALTIR